MCDDLPIRGVKVAFWTKLWTEAAFSKDSVFPNYNQFPSSVPSSHAPPHTKAYKETGGGVRGGMLRAHPAPHLRGLL